MRSLIIGGSGFVGTCLATHLIDSGHQVCGTYRNTDRQVKQQIPMYKLDVTNKKDVFDLLQKIRPDVIYHLAAQSSVARSWENSGETMDVNVKGSLHVLDAVKDLQLKSKILLTGSGEEYGETFSRHIPVTEEDRVAPANIYAVTKACQNMIGSIYAQAFQMDVRMVRAFNQIGPGQSAVFVVSDFCRQAAQIEAGKKDAVIHTGNLCARRDFTDVRDVVRAYVLLIEKGQAGETYNVGTGRCVSIGDILQIIRNQTDREIRVEPDPLKMRPSDIPVMAADIRKLQQTTGWEPQIGLEQTIREMLDYWRGVIK
ncbi:MAG: GDP-mannose 4,6-dehydratase [Eubacterium sp.]|nr:GDP-mannose 4,6-dehydratase [Eubacterium sp.]